MTQELELSKNIVSSVTAPILQFMGNMLDINENLKGYFRLRFSTLAFIIICHEKYQLTTLLNDITSKMHTLNLKQENIEAIFSCFSQLLSDLTHKNIDFLCEEIQKICNLNNDYFTYENTKIAYDVENNEHISNCLINNEVIAYCNEVAHSLKADAKTFLAEHNFDLSDVDELSELENELNFTLYAEEMLTNQTLENAHTLLYEYSKVLGSLHEFSDLSYALTALVGTCKGYDLDSQENSKKRTISLLIRSVIDDLSNWRKVIFVTQEAIDVHYLDASLLSSIAQIEGAMIGCEVGDEDNDLELF